MSNMQRNKGARAEHEVAQLAAAHGFDAVRTRSGGGQARGDVAGVPGHAIEVKRQERLNVSDAFRQASENCGTDTPVVAHRKSREPWLATLPLDDLLALIKAAQS